MSVISGETQHELSADLKQNIASADAAGAAYEKCVVEANKDKRLRKREKVAKCAPEKAAMYTAAGLEAESLHAHNLEHPYYQKSLGADKSPYEKVLADTLMQKRDTSLTLEYAAKVKLAEFAEEYKTACQNPAAKKEKACKKIESEISHQKSIIAQ